MRGMLLLRIQKKRTKCGLPAARTMMLYAYATNQSLTDGESPMYKISSLGHPSTSFGGSLSPDVSKIAKFVVKITVFSAKTCVFDGILAFWASKRRFCGVLSGILNFLFGIFRYFGSLYLVFCDIWNVWLSHKIWFRKWNFVHYTLNLDSEFALELVFEIIVSSVMNLMRRKKRSVRC